MTALPTLLISSMVLFTFNLYRGLWHVGVVRILRLLLLWLLAFTRTHTHLTALCPGLPGWAGTRKVKPIWILLKQEIMSGSEIHWAICKSAPCSRQITTPAPHRSVFYSPYALSIATNSVKALKVWLLAFTTVCKLLYKT